MAAPKPGKMHSPVEHQATVDKGLKMKIKRTKPGTKHEIVKSGENGDKHSNSAKRGSSGHKRDKKHGEKPSQKDVNGVVRCVERVVYPVIKTPPIKEKEPAMNKKVKGGVCAVASGSGVSAGATSVSAGVVLQCSSVPSSPGVPSGNGNQAPVLSPAQAPPQAPSPQSSGLPTLQAVEPNRSVIPHVVSQSSLSSSGSLSPPPLTLQVLPSQSTSGQTPLRPTSPSTPPPPLNHMPKVFHPSYL
ncbi:hypothetical protein GE061_001618 [Apolygus lucorum]|uniref:Uncharacterized protein n=1 Tax=Apolygus lucorum TaxID=248454 RepID=A0A8S9Y9B8_APOLU|nr:hypothetical protein GE061_001618 [Apolygus lucorum]